MQNTRTPLGLRATRALAALALALSVATLGGCGKSAAKISGKVTADGKAVTAGTLVFSPSAAGDKNPGAPATVTVGADGSYSTNMAVPGKNRVIYNSPGAEYPKDYTPKPSEPAPMSPFNGMVPKQAEIEVADGKTIDIELVRPGAK